MNSHEEELFRDFSKRRYSQIPEFISSRQTTVPDKTLSIYLIWYCRYCRHKISAHSIRAFASFRNHKNELGVLGDKCCTYALVDVVGVRLYSALMTAITVWGRGISSISGTSPLGRRDQRWEEGPKGLTKKESFQVRLFSTGVTPVFSPNMCMIGP